MKKHTIICISGKQGSGKTTLAASLVNKYSGTHMKFATPLYEMHEAIRGVLQKYDYEMPKKDGKLLQLLGTEWGRNTLGQNIWVSLTATSIRNLITQLERWHDKAFIVVDDARFENELEMFYSLRDLNPEWNVYTVRLEADEETRKARADAWRDAVDHPSETGLDLRLDDFDMVLSTKALFKEEVFERVCQEIEAF
jgi:dephospho-CoA kinase